MSSTYTVTVDIDVANQTVTASDSIITVPTSNYDIITFDNKSCIRPNTNTSADFDFSASSVVGFTCKIFLQAVNSFTLFCGVRDINNTLYSLVYYPYGYWYNPDNATFDPNNDLVGTWVTVTYSSSVKTLSFDNGTTVLTRILADLVNQLSMVKFNEYDVYLTDLEFEVSIPSSKYLDGTGLSEVWTNTKNYVYSQLLGKQDTLVSGSNIKTVNNQSLLGSGNVTFTPPTFTYDSSTETLTVSNTTATVFNYDANSETLEVQING